MLKTVPITTLKRLFKSGKLENDILFCLPITNYIFCLHCGLILKKMKTFSSSRFPIQYHLTHLKNSNLNYCYVKIPDKIYDRYFADEVREIFLVEEKNYDGCNRDDECVIL